MRVRLLWGLFGALAVFSRGSHTNIPISIKTKKDIQEKQPEDENKKGGPWYEPPLVKEEK